MTTAGRHFIVAGVFAVLLIPALKMNHGSPSKVNIKTDSIPVYSSIQQWQLRVNSLAYIAQRLRSSDLPSRDVAFMTDSLIAPFQSEIYYQVQAWQKADTIGKQKAIIKNK